MPPLGRLVIYTRKEEAMIDFYTRLFGFSVHRSDGDRIVELRPGEDGAALLLHPLSKGQQEGQALVKLVFDVADVAAFCATAKEAGYTFGTLHQADGYIFANIKDPSGNSVSVSSRAFAGP
ncbi:Glyoxalase/Bleomycin resistance protein/Dioxygenase superfamily protein [Roseivivax halotolerans]|uniref:Glyoxalase/Bleomycin resistance protein/Dioxygenase superfamily protein n=1 Tax=Roseivivax halotolerans TaxID=93684 RepID=A0A1I5X325_9RHOB|nr:VOC family protein [Roseivivax halotolerans]SFQ26077.1 Glyoxalase/Bleomycin resistance protein/Dioxygenase superfamily protein [Roseivivax halotolerans]